MCRLSSVTTVGSIRHSGLELESGLSLRTPWLYINHNFRSTRGCYGCMNMYESCYTQVAAAKAGVNFQVQWNSNFALYNFTAEELQPQPQPRLTNDSDPPDPCICPV